MLLLTSLNIYFKHLNEIRKDIRRNEPVNFTHQESKRFLLIIDKRLQEQRRKNKKLPVLFLGIKYMQEILPA